VRKHLKVAPISGRYFSVTNTELRNEVASPLAGSGPVLFEHGQPEITIALEEIEKRMGRPHDLSSAANALVGVVEAAVAKTRIGGEALRELIMPTHAEVQRARVQLHLKAVAILATFASSFVAILASGSPLILRIVAFPFLAVSLIMIATSIMHDANHGAFFGGAPNANKVVGYLSDLLGVSSALWRIKHDIHHADTNVQGIDADIDQGAIARLAPEQSKRAWHRFQHVYLWPLYGFMGVQWLLLSDFTDLVRGRVADQSIADIGFSTRAGILAGKVLHVSWALVLPMLFFPWYFVVPTYLAGSWIMSIVLAVTFQIAHCVDNADFKMPIDARRGDDFVWHQLNTTVNVRPNRSIIGRFRSLVVGGLDYQIEHHLAPHVPHTAYKAMAKRLRDACTENNVVYRTHDGVIAAIKSHSRWLRAMGTSA
jgi:linoleoyl-CoA desaturase